MKRIFLGNPVTILLFFNVSHLTSCQERTRLWMAVARLEGEATRLERQGEKEEAFNLRARANKMRYEDPYTALQDELDEAIKNEVRKSRSPP